MIEVKRSKKSTRSKNFYFSILNLMEKGLNPTQISKKLGLSKQALNYHLSSLKRENLIEKIGYGVWKRSKKINPQEVKKSTRIATINPQEVKILKPDFVRGHGFQFTFSLPKNLRNWEKRRKILRKLKIPFKELKLFGGGEQLLFKGRKIWLTNKSIIIFEKASYITETAQQSKSYVIAEMLNIIKAFEKYLKANFQTYRFKVSRQHYSLIKNALAKQYDKEGKKLQVYNDTGLWFSIDNSFNLHEAETLHPKTADKDNEKVQNFFNGIKQYEDFTPKFIVNTLGGIQQNQLIFDRNMVSHLKVLNKIGDKIEEFGNKMNESIGELNKKIGELK